MQAGLRVPQYLRIIIRTSKKTDEAILLIRLRQSVLFAKEAFLDFAHRVTR
jgi:hypothetical protein